ncbi:MAG: hypothetical protein ACK4S4_15530 [Pyrinomonadaceae bacterium]
MTPEIALFQKTIDQVVATLRSGRPVTLAVSEKLIDALAAGKEIVDKEMRRRVEAGRKGGRPTKVPGQPTRSALTMRATRARRRKQAAEAAARILES